MAAIPRVSPDEAKRLLDAGYTYVDVRSEPEFAAGHPVGAENVPLMHMGPRGMEPNPDFLDVVLALHPKDAKLVLGCRSGQRSLRAAEMLVAAGYADVFELRAGYEGIRGAFGAFTEKGWAPTGLPTETATPGKTYAELKQKLGR
jgi:rhodanese-related sulfurtransferase